MLTHKILPFKSQSMFDSVFDQCAIHAKRLASN